ncbi:hypothetical protein C8R44DRAFT_856102 [Mycena epipterygia]|nr:hypothetical protein C8R44DRAFT_856102 [Mycena epipterygia]
MPPQTTLSSRTSNIIILLNPMITLLNELNDIFSPPFIVSISSTVASLIHVMENVKRNKEECTQLMEKIHRLLYVIIGLHMKPESAGVLPPVTLRHLGKFTETLCKIYTFIEAQQEGNNIKHFFRYSETTLLKDCHIGLQQALEVFKIEAGVTILSNIAEMQNKGEDMHKELLELVATFLDGTNSDRSSSIYTMTNASQASSASFSMLPSQPQIFMVVNQKLKPL